MDRDLLKLIITAILLWVFEGVGIYLIWSQYGWKSGIAMAILIGLINRIGNK